MFIKDHFICIKKRCNEILGQLDSVAGAVLFYIIIVKLSKELNFIILNFRTYLPIIILDTTIFNRIILYNMFKYNW